MNFWKTIKTEIIIAFALIEYWLNDLLSIKGQEYRKANFTVSSRFLATERQPIF